MEATGRRAGGMAEMLSTLGMELIGRHHSGIDDARNIARILVELLRRFHLRVTHTAECKRPKPSQPAPRAAGEPATTSPAPAQVPEHRLRKKLQQMEALERKLQEGKPLNDEQMQKPE